MYSQRQGGGGHMNLGKIFMASNSPSPGENWQRLRTTDQQPWSVITEETKMNLNENKLITHIKSLYIFIFL